MCLKKQLLESIRTSIAESNKRQKDEIDRIRDQHYEVLDYIDQNVKDEEFEANIHNFMLQTGAGPYGMLAAYVDKEKKLAKEKKPEKEAKAIPEETK